MWRWCFKGSRSTMSHVAERSTKMSTKTDYWSLKAKAIEDFDKSRSAGVVGMAAGLNISKKEEGNWREQI